MKNLLAFIFLISTFVTAQETQFCGEIHYDKQPIESCTDKTHFEKDKKLNKKSHIEHLKIFDNFGNIYCEDYFRKEYSKKTANKASISARNGFTPNNRFYLDFVDSPSEEYEDVIRQVFNDVETLIDFQASNCYQGDNVHTVRILIDTELLAVGRLAQAAVYFVKKDDGRRRTTRIWDKINNQYDSYSIRAKPQSVPFVSHDAKITFNTNSLNDLYAGYDVVPMDKFDLYTITLHEIIHLLGFGSLISASDYDSNSPSKFYALFDAYIKNQEQQIIDYNPVVEKWEYAIIDPTLIRDNCPNVRFKTLNDDNAVFSSTSLGYGTPLAHFQANCNGSPDYVMNNSMDLQQKTGQKDKSLCC